MTAALLALTLALAAYVGAIYAGYPLVLFLVSAFRGEQRGWRGDPPSVPPRVALVIPAHNEERVIAAKVENFLGLRYAPDRLRALVISDGSRDGTAAEVRRVLAAAGPADAARVALADRAERTGKTRALGEEVPKLDADVLVFTDANCTYRPDAIEKLTAPFADPRVGLVCGRLRYVSEQHAFMRDEEIYWQYEDMLKRWEGRVGQLLVANGSIYAIRAELFTKMPGAVADDFVHPLRIAADGHRLVYEPAAVAEERLPLHGAENFRAKARIVTRGLEAVSVYWRDIVRSGPVRVAQYLLHKVARWFVGFALVGLFLASLFGARHPFLAAALAGQIAFYSLGFAAYLLSPYGSVPSLLRMPFYFILVNAAAMTGLWDFLRGRRRATWEKSESTRAGGVVPASTAARDAVGRGPRSARPSAALRGLVAATLVVSAVLSVEAAVRMTYLMRERAREWSNATPPRAYLYAYEISDPRAPGNWLLRPGYAMTLRDVVEHDRVEGLGRKGDVLRETARSHGQGDDDVVFRVNADGYKGPDLRAAHDRPRLLAVGDSCTFGSLVDAASYPRALEGDLARRGAPVEVVNAGVGGYFPSHVLARMDGLLALRPEAAVVFIGCNALFAERKVGSPLRESYALRALRALARRFERSGSDARELMVQQVNARRRYDPEASEVARLSDYEPFFLPRLRRMVQTLGRKTEVVILTLPSLYTAGRVPTPEDLELGVLPTFTDNAAVMAGMVGRYNAALRELAEREGATLIDLEPWSLDLPEPRHRFFGGTLSLSPEGEERLAAYVAGELALRVAALRPSPAAGAAD